MGNKNRRCARMTVLLGAGLLMALFFACTAFAGWNTSSPKAITYTDENGEKVTGLRQIRGRVYFFDERGIMKTGWVATKEGYRYFQTEGKAGAALGSMAAGGVVRIGKDSFGFDEEGILLTGFQTIGNDSYYFRDAGKLGVRGRALTDQFRNLTDGRRIYLLEDGRMAVSQWIKNHTYYVDENGNLLRSSITKDGYVLKANGKAKKKLTSSEFVKLGANWYFYKKGKGLVKDRVFRYKNDYYYVNEDGIRQTGWISWGGHDYYFLSNGKAATGKNTIDGEEWTFGSNGQLEGSRQKPVETPSDTDDAPAEPAGTKESTGKASVLIMCGHGQGDSGAVGCNGKYQEAEYTRDFGTRVYEALKKTGIVNVQLYNTNYDMFQQVRSVTGSISYTGSGKKRKKVLAAVKSNSKIPDLTQFDYALEIHFNATAASGKDPKGDGSMKGTGTYVNVYKSQEDRKIDRRIISALNGLGLNTWANGVNGSSGLVNAKTFTELGINYSLLETCFIDDKDDMKFYLKKRDEMAEAVANAIAEYYK